MEPCGVIYMSPFPRSVKRKNPIRGLENLEKKVGNNVPISSKCLAYYHQDPNISKPTWLLILKNATFLHLI